MRFIQMIFKKDYENAIVIKNDKDNFRIMLLNKGYELEYINEFIYGYYENLKSFKYNFEEFKKFLKDFML